VTFWANLIGYQIVWFSAIIGAGRGLWWPGVIAAAVFILLHLAFARQSAAQRSIDVRLLAIAVLIGTLLDGTVAASGFARYAASGVTLLPDGAPLWILAMWASFALTLRHSMTFLLGRPAVSLLFGALGGPIAYLGAARGWQAIAFAEPRWMALLTLAIGWGIAIPLLTTLAVRWSTPSAASIQTAPKRA
jgi:Protein of unknown function (DUF2878)